MAEMSQLNEFSENRRYTYGLSLSSSLFCSTPLPQPYIAPIMAAEFILDKGVELGKTFAETYAKDLWDKFNHNEYGDAEKSVSWFGIAACQYDTSVSLTVGCRHRLSLKRLENRKIV